MPKKVRKNLTIIFTILLIWLVLMYNKTRNSGIYNFDFSLKDISFNFIIFKNILIYIANSYKSILLKFLYFTVIGAICKFIMYLNDKKMLSLLLLIIITIEILHIITGKVIVIDINNWIIYSIALVTGYYLVDISTGIINRDKNIYF